MKALLPFADLHIGGLFDKEAFDEVVEKVVDFISTFKAIDEVDIAFIGDIHDYQGIYSNQVTLEKGHYQPKIAAIIIKRIIDRLSSVARVGKVVLIGGNHDIRKAEGINLLELLSMYLKKMGYNVECHNEQIIYELGGKRILLKHEITRSSGSYAGGITPKILVSSYEYKELTNADIVIVGHYHVFGMKRDLILLPSFQWSSDPKVWDRGSVIVLENGIMVPILTKQRDFDFDAYFIKLQRFYIECLEEFMNIFRSSEGRDEKDGESGNTIRVCIKKKSRKQCYNIERDLYEKVIELKEKGCSIREIADILGIKRWKVEVILHGSPE